MTDFSDALAAQRRKESDELLSDFLPHNGSETSKEAAAKAVSRAESDRETIFAAIVAAGGLTRDEIEVVTEISGNTVRPRVVELVKAGRIEESTTEWRNTRLGCRAAVLQVTQKQERAA